MTSTAIPSSRAVTSSPVVVALDYDNRDKALAFVDRIDPRDCRLKVGKEMFTLLGPQFVRDLHQRGFEVFLDLKFHDIPNTTARAVAAAAELGVWMVNVHASGGARMMTARNFILGKVYNARWVLSRCSPAWSPAIYRIWALPYLRLTTRRSWRR